jgi:peptidyl-prolyl cis-trans isomerase SurA
MMKYFRSIFTILLLCALPQVCGAEITDRIVAIVNNDIVTLREVERYVAVEKKGHYASMYEYLRNMALREKLDTFVESLLISQQARKLKIEVTDKEVDGAIENIKKQNLITDAQLREQLKREGINYKDFVDGIRLGIVRNRVLSRAIAQDVVVDDKVLQDYYDRHRADFVQEEYRLQHIFISRGGEGARARAVEALRQLNDMKPFAEVAKEFSDDPSGEVGGDIGFARKEDLMPELRQAVMSLIPGSITRIVETPYGYHIMKLNEVKKGEAEAFETIKERIKETIYQKESEKRYKEYVGKLKAAAYIEMKI